MTLKVERETKQQREDEHGFDAHSLTFVVLWFSSPCEEGGDILGKLGCGGRSTVFVLNNLVVQRRGHTDLGTGKVRVKVLAFCNGDAGWRLAVPSQEREDVVFVSVTRLEERAPTSSSMSSAHGVSSAHAVSIKRVKVRVRERRSSPRFTQRAEKYRKYIGGILYF